MPSLPASISPFARTLKVLLVEDDAATRLMLATQMKGIFGSVVLACDGRQGLAAMEAEAPDVVLTDNGMPWMSGITMTEEIRKTHPRTPVIFVTSSMDKPLLVRAINLGISSIIPKPVMQANLHQAISLVVGILENEHLQRKTVEQELALLQFKERYHENQQEQAFRKELSILENDFRFRSFTGVPDSDRGEWIAQTVYSPHDIMCGDSYSLRRLPDGSLLVFLADAMGKGLSAALTTSLSVHTFNLQVDALDVRKPFVFREFVQCYTSILGRRLLEDEVFSMCLAWLPAYGAVMETAAFGMPPILAGTSGGPLRKFRCNNPPISAYPEDFATTRHALDGTRTLLLYTDGLNEAALPGGALYREHLDADYVASISFKAFWQSFQDRVPRPGDDVTFLLLTRVDGEPGRRTHWEQESRLEAVEVGCQRLEDLLRDWDLLDPSELEAFCAAFREALMNAYEHGSLGIKGDRKARLLAEGIYFDHLLEAEATVDKPIRVEVSVLTDGNRRVLKATVTDEGEGFTMPMAWSEAPNDLQLHGRGLKMIRKYVDHFFFNEEANAITLLKVCCGSSDADHTNGAH
jgi:CheY-like chemotaxis protein